MANKTINELSPVTLSSTSEFAVYQNGSTGKVTLQNVTNAAADKSINKLGIKNLIPYPYYEGTETDVGITWTDNGDGTITANGTATATSHHMLWARPSGVFPNIIAGQRYILSMEVQNGSCSIYFAHYLGTTNKGEIALRTITDTYAEIEFTAWEDEYDGNNFGLYIGASNGEQINTIIKPMLRLASDTDNTWQPYVATNAALTKQLNNNFLYADDQEEPTGEVEFTSSDTTLTPSSSVSVDLLTGNDSWGQRFAKISQMFKNIRYLLGKLGTTDISNLGNGTVTGAINTVNDKFYNPESLTIVFASSNYTCTRGFAYRIGKMVFVSLQMKSSQQIPAGQGLFRLDYALNQSIQPIISNAGTTSHMWYLTQIVPSINKTIPTSTAEGGGHVYFASGGTIEANTEIYVIGAFICQ